MIPRRAEAEVRRALRESPVVALVGPRQCGKTTLARRIARGAADYFDLEDSVDLSRLANPRLALEELRGLVVLDEVQRKPDIFEVIRVLVDRPRSGARFLLLGSASPHITRGVSETLAGRIRFVEMGGLDVREVGPARHARLWLRGGFPRSFLAASERQSLSWRHDFARTFLERDIPQLGITIPASALRRFWSMVAHYHGQVWNAAELARSLGSSEPTARRYLDILTGAYVVRQLPPWFENIAKRQVKAPKIYVRDSGLLHALLGVRTRATLLGHPKLGASWEGFALEQVLSLMKPHEAYFWATHSGAELDLLIFREGQRLGFEFKCTDAPVLTKSMHVALADLGLRRIFVIYPGAKSYRLHARVEAVSILDLRERLGA
jgi:predicted AAA+ superfamily ATPase